jgi:hypothetical protein
LWILKNNTTYYKVVKYTTNAHRENGTLADPLYPPTGSDKLTHSTGKITNVRACPSI